MKKPSRTLFLIVIAGLSLNAHALCVNQDGSLDDSSVPPSTISVDMLPTCDKQTDKVHPPIAGSATMKHPDQGPTKLDTSAMDDSSPNSI